METVPTIKANSEYLFARIERGELRGKEALAALAQTKQFVFHGSPRKFDELEPRQSYNDGKPDGEPAISAGPDEAYELAIFMALIRSGETRMNVPKGGRRSSFSTQGARDGQWDFRANALALEDAKSPDAIGYVHAFDKKDFQPHTRYEWRAYHKVKPLLVVPVTARDFPEGVGIIE